MSKRALAMKPRIFVVANIRGVASLFWTTTISDHASQSIPATVAWILQQKSVLEQHSRRNFFKFRKTVRRGVINFPALQVEHEDLRRKNQRCLFRARTEPLTTHTGGAWICARLFCDIVCKKSLDIRRSVFLHRQRDTDELRVTHRRIRTCITGKSCFLRTSKAQPQRSGVSAVYEIHAPIFIER